MQQITLQELRASLKVFESTWNIKELSDWYNASKHCFRCLRNQFDTEDHGGVGGLLSHAYPEHKWEPEKFPFSTIRWDKTSQEKYMENLGRKLGFTKMEDWYSISGKHFAENDGTSLVNLYYSSPTAVVMGVFTNHTWIPWKFRHVPTFAWEEEGAFRKFGEYLFEKKGFTKKEDFYQLAWSDLRKYGGRRAIEKHFDGMLWKFVTKTFPEYNLKPWLFVNCLKGVWEDMKVQRAYLEYLGEKLNIKNMDEWYKLTRKDFTENKGEGILNQYDFSVGNVIAAVMCEHQWEMWRFVSPRIRDDRATILNYMKYMGDKLGFTKMEDWYRVTAQDFYRNAGATLVHRYKNLSALVNDAFPEHDWLPWRFYGVKGLWDEKETRVKFMTHLAKKLNYTQLEDWYQVTQGDFLKNGGKSLIKYYNGSPSAVVTATFPEKDWLLYRFKATPKHLKGKVVESVKSGKQKTNLESPPHKDEKTPAQLLSSISSPPPPLPPSPSASPPSSSPSPSPSPPHPPPEDNDAMRELRKAFAHLETQLGVTHLEEWYRVSTQQIQKHVRATRSHIAQMGLPSLLRVVYPQHTWDESKFPPTYYKLSKQRMMKILLAKYLLPKGTQLLENFSHNSVFFEKNAITSDLFIPSLKLSLEYQGKQHYQSTDYFGDANNRSEYDEEKKIQLEKMGYTVVNIPYWWDGKPDLLIELIRRERPEIQFSYNKEDFQTEVQQKRAENVT